MWWCRFCGLHGVIKLFMFGDVGVTQRMYGMMSCVVNQVVKYVPSLISRP